MPMDFDWLLGTLGLLAYSWVAAAGVGAEDLEFA